MSAIVDCAACEMGQHEKHDGRWHGTEGLIGGHQCHCRGECVGRPNPFQPFLDVLNATTDEEPTDWIKDAGWLSGLYEEARRGNRTEFEAMLRRLLSEHARTAIEAKP